MAHNLISGNLVSKNVLDCGITMAGHNPKAAQGGKPAPKVGGVYRNTITANTANGNGVKGEGAGILMAGAGPRSRRLRQRVRANTANGNGIAGVTIHNHAPGQDLNGNKILSNHLSHNGLDDTSEAEFGGADFAKNTTVDILVGSGVDKLTGTVITRQHDQQRAFRHLHQERRHQGQPEEELIPQGGGEGQANLSRRTT